MCARGWQTAGARTVEPPCLFWGCFTRATKVELVARGRSVIKPGFRPKRFVLSELNTDVTFGLVEHHDRQQVSSEPKRYGAKEGSHVGSG